MAFHTTNQNTVANTASLLRILADFGNGISSVFLKLHGSTRALEQRITKLGDACEVVKLHLESGPHQSIKPLGIKSLSNSAAIDRIWENDVIVPWDVQLTSICDAEPQFNLISRWTTQDGQPLSKLFSDPEYYVDQWIKEQEFNAKKEQEAKRLRKAMIKERGSRSEMGRCRASERQVQRLEKKQYKLEDFSIFSKPVLADAPQHEQAYQISPKTRDAWVDLLCTPLALPPSAAAAPGLRGAGDLTSRVLARPPPFAPNRPLPTPPGTAGSVPVEADAGGGEGGQLERAGAAEDPAPHAFDSGASGMAARSSVTKELSPPASAPELPPIAAFPVPVPTRAAPPSPPPPPPPPGSKGPPAPPPPPTPALTAPAAGAGSGRGPAAAAGGEGDGGLLAEIRKGRNLRAVPKAQQRGAAVGSGGAGALLKNRLDNMRKVMATDDSKEEESDWEDDD